MDRELTWLLCPLWGALYALGGYKRKEWRRYGIPLTLLVAGLFFHTPIWRLLCSVLLLSLSLRLPFTLVGDDATSFWGNWVWIWCLPLLQSSPALLLGTEPLAVLVPLVVCGLVGTLSNLQWSARFAPWKAVECAWGFSLAYPYCLALSSL